MGNIVTIAYKELKSYFVSWMAYVVMGVYLGIAGFIFFEILMASQQDVHIEWLYHNMSVTLLFVLPFITARLLAEEKSSGTLEILLTSPVTDVQLVLGKFLGAFSMFNIMLVLSCLFPLILAHYLKVFEMAGIKVVAMLVGPLVLLGLGLWYDARDNDSPGWLKWLTGLPAFCAVSLIIGLLFIAYGNVQLWSKEVSWVTSGVVAALWLAMLAIPRVRDNDGTRLACAPAGLLLYNLAVTLVLNQGTGDMASTVAGYVGLLLVGACFLSVGVLASSLTDNQFVAGVLGFGSLLFLWIVGWAKDRMSGLWADVVGFISVLSHFQEFPEGTIDTKDVIYFLSFILLCLFFAVRAVESRKWR